MKTEYYEIIETRVPLEKPAGSIIERCQSFRSGQQDRKANNGCLSANGAYLDGWYSPEKLVPPYITQAQALAFQL